MSESTLPESLHPLRQEPARAFHTAAREQTCDECLGSGGWFRYEPALDPAPGRLYLSCLHCRGTGRTAEARA